jgi:hypothetical protein
MSTTLTRKQDEQQRKVQLQQMEEQLRKQKEEEQQQRLTEQNWWFYSLMDIDKVKSAKTTDKKLKVVRKNVATENKKDKKQQKTDVAEAKFEPLYNDRLARSMRALDDLKSYAPAAASLIKKFEDAHKKAADILEADEGAWKAAFEALHDVSESNSEEDAEKLWAQGEKDARKAAPDFFKSADQSREKLLAARKVLTVEAYEALNGRLESITGSLCQSGGPAPKEVGQATQALGKFDKSLTTATTNAINDGEQAKKLRVDVENTLTLAKGVVKPHGGFPKTDLANFQRQFTSIDTNIGLRDYVSALQLLEALRTQIETKSDAIEVAGKTAQSNWKSAKNDLAGLKSRAEKLMANQSLPESVRKAATETDQRIATLIAAKKVGEAPTFTAAVEEVDEIRADLDRFEQTAGDVPAFKKAREEANKRVRALMDQAAHAIEALPGALNKANGGKDIDSTSVVGPFNDELAGLLIRWESLMGSAVDASELMEDAVTADLRKLLTDVNTAATTGAGDAVLDINLAPAREEFEKLRDKAMSVAKSVLNLRAEEGANLLEAIDSAESAVNAATTAQQIQDVTKSLKELVDKNANTSGGSDLAIPQFQEMLRKKLAGVPDLIKTLQEETNKKKTGEKQQPFVKLLDTVQTDYETLLVLVGSTQKDMLEQALDEADALIQEIGNATKDVSGKAGKKDQTFDAAKKRIEGYTKRLAADDVQTYALATATELTERLNAFTKGLGTITVTQLYAELDQVGDALDKAETKAKESKERVKKFEELIDQQKKRLDAAPFKTDSPEFATATKTRLDQILSDARFEDGLQSASADFNRLLKELDDAAASPKNLLGQAVDLVDKNDKAVEAKRAGELDKSKWEGELLVVEKQLNAAKGGEIDSDEIAGLKTTFEGCKKMVAKTQQFADGREQLKAIAKRLSLLEANPYGLVISARNKLPQLTAFVKGEIIRTSKALAEISGAVEKIPETDLPAGDKKQVAGQLAAVRGLFNPAAFDKSIPVVASPKIDRNKRASARETALKDVRRMMSYVDNDFRLQALAITPYKGDMRAVISGLKLGLLDLENNLLISMAK